MNQTPNSNYRTNESVGKMFLHSCLGKFIILAAVVVVLLIIAFLTKPTDQEMRDEMNDNIMQCMEMNDSIRGDQIDDFVHNIGFIFTTADSTKVGKEWREVFDKYNRLEIYNHAFFRTAYVYNNKSYNQRLVNPTIIEGDLGTNPNIQEFHYKRNPDD